MADAFIEEAHLYCVICGRALGELLEDQPDWPAGPLCGECYQARQADDEVFGAELEQG